MYNQNHQCIKRTSKFKQKTFGYVGNLRVIFYISKEGGLCRPNRIYKIKSLVHIRK